MAEILVLVDHESGQVTKPSLEALAAASSLGEASAVVLGEGAAAAAPQLAAHGAQKVYTVGAGELDAHLVVHKAYALHDVVKAANPEAVITVSSMEGREIAARLAVMTESGIITDAVDIKRDGDALVATKSVFAGGFTTVARVTKGAPIITLRPNSFAVSETAAAGEVVEVASSVPADVRSAKITSRTEREKSGRPELAEAAIVVSGGRGTDGNFAPVEGFADALGAAVGASRAAVDAGWYPHANQVGQTGKQVSPQLYVANGISGAIQHRAGMQTSKVIVAVNTDDEAPIFEMVDFGVVGDLFEVLPAATEKINAGK